MSRTSSAVLAEAISSFPATFGLRGHPGTFRICPVKSYTNDTWNGQSWTVANVQLVIQTVETFAGSEPWKGGADPKWVDFCRCTDVELRKEARR